MTIKGVIFDMDGVLVDSEPVITEAAVLALSEWGIAAEHGEFREFTGMGDDAFIGNVAEKHGVPYDTRMKERAYEIYLDIASEKIRVFHGARAVIEKFWENGFTVAIASAADRVRVEANIACIGVRRDYFTAVVTGNDVTAKKPAPDIYLKTALIIGLKPENCMVVEDSLAGVRAAKAAKMYCVAVTTSFTQAELIEAGADMVVDEVFDSGDMQFSDD